MYSSTRPRYQRTASPLCSRCAYGRRGRRSRSYLPATRR